MKVTTKFIIIVSILVLITILSVICIKFFASHNITPDKSNLKIYNEVDGESSEYQLTLTASYGGFGVDGQNLGSGKIIKKYNISDNDIFYEPTFGGIWKLNFEQKNDTENSLVPEIILKINKINNENIELEYNNKKHTIEYNKEISIPSNFTVFDGQNYSYTIKISKEK